jgi:hypothetical protein
MLQVKGINNDIRHLQLAQIEKACNACLRQPECRWHKTKKVARGHPLKEANWEGKIKEDARRADESNIDRVVPE